MREVDPSIADAGVGGRTRRSGTDRGSHLLWVAVIAVVVGGPVAALAVPVGAISSETASSPGEDCDDDSVVFLSGCLDAAGDNASDWSASDTYTVPEGTEEVVIELSGPASADFDLYVTVDGRRPTPKDNDHKSEGTDSTERIVLEGEDISAGVQIGILAYAYNGSGEFEVTVRRVARPVASFDGPDAVDPNEAVTFDASGSAVPTPPATYVWSVDGTEVQSGSNETLTYDFQDEGTHAVSLTVEGADGASATTTKSVAVGSGAVDLVARADVLAGDRVWVNQTVRLTAERSHSKTGTIQGFEWRVDGKTLTGETVEYAFDEPGTYDVTLTVEGELDATATTTVTVVVREPDVWVRSVEGASTRIMPDYLFAGCMDPVRVTTEGSQSVERVEFSLGDTTITDDDGGDGWMIDKKRLPTGQSDTLEVTAVGARGATDTEVVRIQTATSPKGVRALSDIFNKYINKKGNVVSKRWTPIIIKDCSYVLRYPQIARNLTSIPMISGGSFDLPDKLTKYFTEESPLYLSAKFKFAYHPKIDQVSIGGGGLMQMHLNPNPMGESRTRGEVMVNGYFSLPQWKLKQIRMHGYAEARIYLEEYVSPVPIPSYRVHVDNPAGIGPDPLVNATIDPIDVWLAPRINFKGSVNSEFELSSLAVDGQGKITLHGQLGDECHFNPAGFGCFGLRAWAEGTLKSDYMGLLPFDPELKGTALVEVGFSLRTPTNLVPGVTKTWGWDWDLPSAVTRVAPATTNPVPGARAHAGVPTEPSGSFEARTDRRFGPKRTTSPGATYRNEAETRPVTPACVSLR